MRVKIEDKDLLLSKKCEKQMLHKDDKDKLIKLVNEIKNNDYQKLEIDYIYYGFDGIFLTNNHQILSYNEIRKLIKE